MRVVFAILLLFLPCLAQAAEEEKLSLPRFASLKSEETNVRAGPGTRYAIRWVYRREGLPVEILQEFDAWREIRDPEGTKGWVHKYMLSGRRTAMIMKETRALKREPEADAPILLRAEPGVIGQVLECENEWCRLQIASRKGWLRKKEFFGAYAKEKFKD